MHVIMLAASAAEALSCARESLHNKSSRRKRFKLKGTLLTTRLIRFLAQEEEKEEQEEEEEEEALNGLASSIFPWRVH